MTVRVEARADVLPNEQELSAVFAAKYETNRSTGWMQRLWRQTGYFSPDDVYEATVSKLVFAGCNWLDVGCGRNLFPGNNELSHALARRCGYLLGADPDETIFENPFVHDKVQSGIESLQADCEFDLITLRMVAEHVEDPEPAVAALYRLAKPGGLVVVLTVNRWSPAALATRAIPHALHHPIKRWLWETEAKDTFRVCYRMNTRRELVRYFAAAGFRECAFAYLDDCRSFYRFGWLHRADVAARNMFRRAGLPHPENCLLGIYERLDPDKADSQVSHTPGGRRVLACDEKIG